jgi:ABC-type sugar transport system ATPase subunit
LFFRPESVEFLEEAAAADNSPNQGAGVLERVTFLGNSADVMIRCNDVKLRVRTHPARTPGVGKAVRFAVAPSSCIVFPS